jgi:hypothetical protein
MLLKYKTMNDQEIKSRADELINISKSWLGSRRYDLYELEKCLQGTLSLIKYCYGENSNQFEILFACKKAYTNKLGNSLEEHHAISNIIGILENLKSDIDLGLITSIEKQTAGVIYIDMLSLAKKLMDEGFKDSSSVLACGAFEDCMKKFALQNELSLSDASLDEIINALKSKSLMQSPQAALAKSFIQLRNKSFHAKWDAIGIPEIQSLIAFLEGFILKNFQ